MSGVDIIKIVRACANRLVREYFTFNLDVEDLVSEGYLIACEQVGKFDKKRGVDLGTYIYSEVYLRLKNYVSRDTLKHEVDRVSLTFLDDERCTEIDERAMDLRKVRERMKGQDADIYDCISLGYSYREIAAILGISKSGIERIVKTWRGKYGDGSQG